MAYAPLRRRYSGARWLLRFEPGHMHIVIPGVEVFTFLPLNKRMTRKLKKTQIQESTCGSYLCDTQEVLLGGQFAISLNKLLFLDVQRLTDATYQIRNPGQSTASEVSIIYKLTDRLPVVYTRIEATIQQNKISFSLVFPQFSRSSYLKHFGKQV